MHCCLFAQQNYNDLPLSAVLHLSSNIYTVELQKPDVNKLLLQDEKNAENGKPMRNGYVYSVDYDLNNSGTISYLCEGGKLWRITIKAEGAKFLACSLENLSFTDGAKLYLYNRERTGFFNYSNENLKEQSKLFSPQIPGDEITIEYYEPGGIQFQTDLKISKIVYYYK
jgi:hypothetical protein